VKASKSLWNTTPICARLCCAQRREDTIFTF